MVKDNNRDLDDSIGFMAFIREQFQGRSDFGNSRRMFGRSSDVSREFTIDRNELWMSTVIALKESLNGITEFKI